MKRERTYYLPLLAICLAGGLTAQPYGYVRSNLTLNGRIQTLTRMGTVQKTYNAQSTGTDGDYSPDGTKYYVLGFNTITVLETATFQVVASTVLSGDFGYSAMAISPDGSTLVLGANEYATGNVAVLFVDTATLVTSGETVLPINYPFIRLCVSADNRTVFVGLTSLYALNIPSHSLAATYALPYGDSVGAVTLSATDHQLYLGTQASFGGYLLRFNPATRSFTGNASLDNLNPNAVAVSPDGTRIFTGGSRQDPTTLGGLFVHATTGLTRLGFVAIGELIDSIAIGNDGKQAYLTSCRLIQNLQSPLGLPVLRLIPCVCMPSPIPRQDRWDHSLVLSH